MLPMNLIFVTREDWPEWYRINKDSMDADATYDQWRKNVKEFADEFVAKGGTIKEIPTTPAQFLAWCEKNNLKPSSSARSQYAAREGK